MAITTARTRGCSSEKRRESDEGRQLTGLCSLLSFGNGASAALCAFPVPLDRWRLTLSSVPQPSTISVSARNGRARLANNALDVFRCKELGYRDRPGDGAKEAIRLHLVPTQRGAELLHFRWRWRSQVRKPARKLVYRHPRFVALTLIGSQRLVERAGTR